MMAATMNGIDIASYQKDMDVSKVDADFVIIKITQGDYYVNPNFDKHFRQAKASRKLIGAYHYSNGITPVDIEVNQLLNAIKPYLGEVIICLDWESNGKTKQSGYNPMFRSSEAVKYVKEFMDKFHNATGIWPFFYASASVTREKDWSSVAENSPLWVAQYANDNLTGYQENPYRDKKGTGAWKEVMIHQYSPSGTIKGYEQKAKHKLDLDISYLTELGWEALAKGEKIDKKTNKTTPELVDQVLSGVYGSGAVRKNKLTSLGYDYSDVQSKVNMVLNYAKDIQKIKDNTESSGYWGVIVKRLQ